MFKKIYIWLRLRFKRKATITTSALDIGNHIHRHIFDEDCDNAAIAFNNIEKRRFNRMQEDALRRRRNDDSAATIATFNHPSLSAIETSRACHSPSHSHHNDGGSYDSGSSDSSSSSSSCD